MINSVDLTLLDEIFHKQQQSKDQRQLKIKAYYIRDRILALLQFTCYLLQSYLRMRKVMKERMVYQEGEGAYCNRAVGPVYSSCFVTRKTFINIIYYISPVA